jgi:hypothetical protein
MPMLVCPNASQVHEYASQLESGKVDLVVPVSAEVHKRGINLRHIGLLRSLVKTNKAVRGPTSIHPSIVASCPYFAECVFAGVLLIEVVARTLKGMLRAKLRAAMRETQGQESSRHLLRLTVTEFLNEVCCLFLPFCSVRRCVDSAVLHGLILQITQSHVSPQFWTEVVLAG